MKFALALLALLSATEAFTQPSNGRPAVSTKMSEETPMLKIKEKVECFGAAPLIGDGKLFLGENYWDKLTTEIGSAETGDFIRAAEVKHGRSAMLATVGFAFQKMGITFDKFSPHEYLSVTQNVKFADLEAMGPIAAIKAVPAAGLAQVFFVIAAIEIYELTHRDGEIKDGESVAPGLQAGGLNGYNLNWNPLKIKITDRRKLSELQNGRAAMFAISAWVSAEAVSGSVPIPLPW
mmetsp:Transcript_12651/g.16631  ORF Transcript_12651/g.16631 Transcript_12651/m.16631 type:complete len:235 (-) Transcript_12651:80-784(-)|eukprot:CAMPEP_0198138506 /NCGR_PEP_ID=MMETSP1443-20131203/1897_1 /TAXON_ID=186043 /ORGANISM="Entomoneis sp., Strain CCMP2396" /LENGTH=234 /DNA_ID=CAMNT_0043800301 /DNA_START=81 /DNA_END=785 /DNA_ORIENTATION=+